MEARRAIAHAVLGGDEPAIVTDAIAHQERCRPEILNRNLSRMSLVLANAT